MSKIRIPLPKIKEIERFEAAVRADEFKGGGHPNDIPAIEEEYHIAKAELILKLKRRTIL